jgi:hypothetical protein
MPTNFFHFAAEIRLKIYEELLVLSEPITFRTIQDPSWPPLCLSKRYGLCPAVLRVNKRVQCEARPLLYSSNRFRFSDLEPTPRLDTKSAVLASFLSQIEAFFATSASISPPLTITDPEPPCSKKIVLKLWSSSETTAQISPCSRHRYATLFNWNMRTICSTVH